MNLPEKFIERMKSLLSPEEFKLFEASYSASKSYGLRINPLKIKSQDALPFFLNPVPWAKEGFYALPEEKPGRHILHEAGAYYIQEPSAMSVAALLDAKPGDIVCDLCAAPGGKSTQIAGMLDGEGLLVSNEIFPQRAKILSQNIERLGIKNAVVCNETPENMAKYFPSFFDKIVVDAPCSGEGMFRKDDIAVEEWTPDNVALCSERQKSILSQAQKMLKPDGVIVYSTCTFAPAENEDILIWFLREYPDFHVEDYHDILGIDISNGNPDFVSDELKPLTEDESNAVNGSLRLWPHKIKGEGHFAVRLRKNGGEMAEQKKKKKSSGKNILSKSDRKQLVSFLSEFLADTVPYADKRYEYFGDELYMVPDEMPELKGIKLIRAGLHIATRKKNRFEPAHAFAKYLKPADVKYSFECSTEQAEKYLHGDVIQITDNSLSDAKGFALVCYNGLSLGWGKITNSTIKNHYPKGLRINY
ncbi:RsmF rRNA methyltransferase first C-terminal domain-containing protein [Eubacterium sp. MSJ-13]|uniref:RsmF rRNA methyltransferase first C-terminal domain-containing protein n=1 Tax=Eubacterium sp. MSJ-13 TaxID=2841513 RepID=UPI001C113BEA|nr:RsmF rRNA methyltransferase first C-terminal domain-containing protein [Eubacterium sp. MSJ-13]MBU5479147.1 RsmF rRNA methyltransferase first C-terminal domain-containing protein [Eubacterium sp. MSJ-13]